MGINFMYNSIFSMHLYEITIKNFRSIKSVENVKISPLQILIGENNAGKSNLLYALNIFLSAGAKDVSEADFNDPAEKIIITARFEVKSPALQKIWRPYMISGDLYLEKHIWIEKDPDSDKNKINTSFHGYKAEPSEAFLSIKKLEESSSKVKWLEVVQLNNLPEYFINEGGKCNKPDFKAGLERYLQENDVQYDEPDLSSTQALGFQSKAIANLPKFYLLRADSNYQSETDKRSTTTTFRQLMGDLTDRIIKTDPKYKKIEESINTITSLLNNVTVSPGDASSGSSGETRMEVLGVIEDKISEILKGLMPSIQKVNLRIEPDEIKTIFSRGVTLTINDGVETEVLYKGHGLQRCVLFSLLRALILNDRDQLVEEQDSGAFNHPLILAIEEPELYIHPQLGKLFYDNLLAFSESDQVIYTTHSPRFLDVYRYDTIALVKKDVSSGTKIKNFDPAQFSGLTDKDIFKKLTQLNSDVNELFFATKVLLVEGPEDKIAITETVKKLKMIDVRLEEKDITIIVAGGKQSIPFFQRVMNAFDIPYVVLHDLDIKSGMSTSDQATEEKRNKSIYDLVADPSKQIVTFPIKLEETLGLAKHFSDQYDAMLFFSDEKNINSDLEGIVQDALKKIEG